MFRSRIKHPEWLTQSDWEELLHEVKPRTSESDLPQGCFQESKSVEGGEPLPGPFENVLFSIRMRSTSYFITAVMVKRPGYQKLPNFSWKYKGWLRPWSSYPSMTMLPPLQCPSLVSLLKSRIWLWSGMPASSLPFSFQKLLQLAFGCWCWRFSQYFPRFLSTWLTRWCCHCSLSMAVTSRT